MRLVRLFVFAVLVVGTVLMPTRAAADPGPPAIVSASASPSTVTVGTPVVFSVGWTDAGDTVRAVICRTNAIAAGVCPGGPWTTGPTTTTSPAMAALTPFQGDLGTQTWYAFVCDAADQCSSSLSGTFTVQNRVPTATSAGVSPSVVKAGDTVTFSVGWSDVSDTVTGLFCRTNSLTGGACTGGAWATSTAGTTTPATATYTTTAADAGTNQFWAFVCDSVGACSSSLSGSFKVRTLALTASTQTPVLGDNVTLTATANASVSGTGWAIQIYELTSGTRVALCTTGSICSVVIPNDPPSPVTRSYKAYIATNNPTPPPPDVQAQSDTVHVGWGVKLAIALTAAPPAAAAGNDITLNAHATRDTSNLGFVISIYEHESGLLVVSCATGSTCSTTVTQPVSTTRTYTAYVAFPSATNPPPNVQAVSNSVIAVWQAPPPPPEGPQVEIRR